MSDTAGIPPGFTFADNFRAFCALRGVSHRDVAEALGMPLPTVSRWANGIHTNPHRSHIEHLAKAFGVSPEGFASSTGGFASAFVRIVEASGCDPEELLHGRAPDVRWTLGLLDREAK